MPSQGPAAPSSASAASAAPGSPLAVDMLDTREFTRNMLTVGVKSQKLMLDFIARMGSREDPGPIDPLNISGAMLALAKAMGGDREAVAAAQSAWWNNFMILWESTARRMLGGEAPAVVQPAPGDRRFRSEEWQKNEIFDFIKQSYLLTANAMQEMVGNLHGLDEKERGRVAFYTRQFADALAPTNFPLTNPEVLRATIASNGENLVKGLDNLLADIERGHGELSIRQSADGFVIGENIATTPGKVVFRNEIIELLQYSPTTDEVHERPLLIFPPWINKFYILDLRPENSFVRWLVGQGYTVFLVSWVNPDPDMAAKGFEDYMQGGIFAALEAVEKATGVRDPNCVGYCIGGTLLAATLAYMAAVKEKAGGGDRIHSATFWAAQTDFSEAGELSVFVDEAQLDALKQKMDSEGGVLPGSKMAGAFNMLRANDLIWSFVINNYLLGKQPMPFDLLYWNSDTTQDAGEAASVLPAQLLQGKCPGARQDADCGREARPFESHGAGLSAIGQGRPHRPGGFGVQVGQPVRRAGAFHHCRLGPYRGRDQSAGGQEIPVLDQRGRRHEHRGLARGFGRASGLLVAGLGPVAVQAVGRNDPRAPAGRRRAESSGRRAGDLCEGQGAVGAARHTVASHGCCSRGNPAGR